MRGFKTRTGIAELTGWISAHFGPLEGEDVPLAQASGRVLAGDIVALFPVPAFDRAAMDGYAVGGEETFGASAYTPAAFRCVGRSRPGLACGLTVGPSEAVQIATGAPMPAGTDAVVPFEIHPDRWRIDLRPRGSARRAACESLGRGHRTGGNRPRCRPRPPAARPGSAQRPGSRQGPRGRPAPCRGPHHRRRTARRRIGTPRGSSPRYELRDDRGPGQTGWGYL